MTHGQSKVGKKGGARTSVHAEHLVAHSWKRRKEVERKWVLEHDRSPNFTPFVFPITYKQNQRTWPQISFFFFGFFSGFSRNLPHGSLIDRLRKAKKNEKKKYTGHIYVFVESSEKIVYQCLFLRISSRSYSFEEENSYLLHSGPRQRHTQSRRLYYILRRLLF